MDRAASTKLDALEHMLVDETVKPTDLPLSLLEYITDNFSDDKQLGRGGFAVVYKGKLRNGTVAVKKMFYVQLDESKFQQEVECLMKAKHKNVVRFLGYCSDTQGKMENYNGKLVMADVPQRLLCFEYLPKGSLHEYITATGASRELKWTQCYQIIKGICMGLHYLHENRIVHLDLKPANILLDKNMVPKIADFGLSRCFDEKQSHAITSKVFGSRGYLAPEFYSGRIITFKSDIYSLGIIIIEIMTREKMYPEDYDVLKTWGNRLEKSQREKQLEQLQLCAEIGKECTKDDPRRRPDALTIVRRLHEADITDISVLTDMSNLSIAQEEQHGDGCNSIGAIGSKQSLEYLVRMSRSEYGSVARQSRDFRSLVRSGEIYRLRRMAGVAEHWIYLSCNFVEWNAYDPDRQHWIEVPKMPEDEFFRNAYMESLAVGTNLLVFGLGKGKERILLKLLKYSIRTNSWIRTDPMNYPRCLFGSASVGHKAYLAGGIDCYERVVLSSVEMHDCEKNNWAPLPNMNKARMLCSGVFMDGKLYVIGGKGSNNEELTCGEEYDFEQGSWNVIENMTEGLNVRLSSGAPPLVEVVNNQLYGADYIEKNVKKYDKQNNRWITLGRWPESIASSSMNGWCVGFKACGDQLIMIGCPRPTSNPMVELYSWVPDGRRPVWNLVARRNSGNFLHSAAVMSC